ncbi:cellulose-binding, family II, bacterial type [Lentisphaera araneosa HTCC2155]|jgi:endoglucanase|uniref:Cellulose-binding, family II, bacterial type n=1 Tax=Lentisphaera araneosa HTCC2155 TaxID=313628 RepID=A6DTJ4_9BACT|nr:glycoside hydrolase family 5 protein [Lentisphaera araneosa]EDM25033.1 cellulose-binding, family II, bacterial type [Lentisphaera araneosa HTCC2155]
MYVNNNFKLMNRMKIFFFLLCALASFSLHSQSAFQQHGKLKLIGTQLCDQNNKPVQLKGMSTHGLQWHGWGTFLNEKNMDVLAHQWQADILRIAMYYDEGGYKSNPKKFTTMVDTLVEESHKRGLYSIVDWHILKPGDPWKRIEEAKIFFDYMSKKHAQKGSVLYEICNEPNGKNIDWPRIKSYAEEIIPIIRKNDPDGIILIGTPDWASLGLSGDKVAHDIITKPLDKQTAHNVMFSFHFYAASHGKTYRDGFKQFLGKAPLFITEWGSQEASGEGKNDWHSVKEWHKILDQHKISWCNWNYSPGHRSSAVWKQGTTAKGPFNDQQLKESGRKVKQLILAK